jgi:hypothetical protein
VPAACFTLTLPEPELASTGSATRDSDHEGHAPAALAPVRVLDHEPSRRALDPHVVSVACGHLRERSAGVGGSWIAIDQDPESLALVQRDHDPAQVRTVCASVSALVRSNVALPPADLVYSSGLYDYLSRRMASRLTRFLLSRLKVGGNLLIANFAPGTFGRGYLSGVMDWDRNYRDEHAFSAVFDAWDAPLATWRVPRRDLVFAETWRRSDSPHAPLAFPGRRSR